MKACTTLLAGYAALIAYASLYPFGWEFAGVDALGLLHGKWSAYAPNADNAANLLAYLPLGLLLALCLSGIGSFALRVIVATLAGAALSLSMEFLQQYVPTRVASVADLATNTCGALAGALLASFLDPARFPGHLAARWRAQWVKPGREYDLGLIVVGAWALSQWLPAVPSLSVGNLRAGLAPAWQTLHELSGFDLLEFGRYTLYLSGLALLVRTLGNPGRPVLRVFFVLVAAVLACKVPVIGRQLSLEAVAGAAAAIVLSSLWLALRVRAVARVAGLFVLGGLLCAHLLRAPDAAQHLSHWAPFRGPIDHLFLGLGSVLEILWPPAALGYLTRLAVPASSRASAAWIGGGVFALLLMLAGMLGSPASPIPLVTIVLMGTTWTLFARLFIPMSEEPVVGQPRVRRRASSPALSIAILVLACTSLVVHADRLHAETLRVGPQHALKAPSAAAKVARDGDVIEIEAGLYAGDAAVWRRSGLTIRGIGGRAQLRADGAHAEGKAIWVIKGANTTVENIEFSGAKVPGRNGAGIRLEGSGLTVRNCYFHHNEMGILTGANPASDVVIERSEFAHNMRPDGHNHNVYIGAVRSFTLRESSVHHAVIGHNVKSRALQNFILYNRIMDERDGRSSYALELVHGGLAFVIGNVIQQGTLNDNRTIVAFGTGGLKNPVNELHFVANTVVNEDPRGARFLFIKDGAHPARILNNVFAGTGTLLVGPGEPKNNARVRLSELAAPEKFDYRLKGSAASMGAPLQ
ncbi:MAG TPA: VanZ family protein [Burkholderiales bacterium]|nr:VanZ family protein [Burkholderiales bacterium]